MRFVATVLLFLAVVGLVLLATSALQPEAAVSFMRTLNATLSLSMSPEPMTAVGIGTGVVASALVILFLMAVHSSDGSYVSLRNHLNFFNSENHAVVQLTSRLGDWSAICGLFEATNRRQLLECVRDALKDQARLESIGRMLERYCSPEEDEDSNVNVERRIRRLLEAAQSVTILREMLKLKPTDNLPAAVLALLSQDDPSILQDQQSVLTS